ncbi:nhp2-like protein [Anaeramoeba flamelloides]|uniref:H/ACA ribonucleoprotein complex subunit 2 n=1 Tax=Anaeramoeba flamelloides TaxID=1746091 RepID=A0AAV7ZCG3_9EUKA|nr:nhp2-like protein [Anaeramoeba flamelloides]KAJ6251902.1 nhp2-like protein [Anaeramoeba flamelloides]
MNQPKSNKQKKEKKVNKEKKENKEKNAKKEFKKEKKVNKRKKKARNEKKKPQQLKDLTIPQVSKKDRIKPTAPKKLVVKILDLCKSANQCSQLKKGVNETTKSLKKQNIEFVVLAADTHPLEVLLHIPLLCQDKSVPFCFLPSTVELGRSCEIERPMAACAILQEPGSQLKREIETIKLEIENLM